MNATPDSAHQKMRDNLASLLMTQGKFGEVEPLFREALQKRRSTLGAARPDTLTSMNNLAELLRAQGKFGNGHMCICVCMRVCVRYNQYRCVLRTLRICLYSSSSKKPDATKATHEGS